MRKIERTRTGIPGLDSNLEGGFPRGSMVMVAGNPGTGKTMLCGEFLHHGASEEDENGLYVSFSEGRETFLTNMDRFGLDFEPLMGRGKVEILDLVSSKEPGVDAIMEMVTERIEENRVRRLVIDSFSAVAHALPSPVDERVVLHLLSKIVRTTECTTILVTEVPTGQKALGTGIEEFIVDGIIVMRRRLMDGCVLRELETAKMRGTVIGEPRQIFSLHGGFTVFEPFREAPIKQSRPFRSQPNAEGSFSTGSPATDEMLGGYGRGETIYVELGQELPLGAPRLLLGPLLANFVSQGMGVLQIPTCGQGTGCITDWMAEYGMEEDAVRRLLRVAEISGNPESDAVLRLDPDDVKISHRIWNEEKQRLALATGRPVLKLINIDKAGVHWPLEPTRRVLEAEAKLTRNEGGLLVLVSTPGDGGLRRDAINMSSVHLRLSLEQGVVLLQGVRPRTPLYAMEPTGEDGYPSARLTQMN